MKTLYVVRGLGVHAVDIWVSPTFDVTMLHDDGEGDWLSLAPNRHVLCEEGFRHLIGIALEPGEYTTIQIQEVD